MSDYFLAKPLVARVLGLGLILLGVAVFAATLFSGWLGLSVGALLGGAAFGVVALVGAGAGLTRVSVLRLEEDGYRIRMIRGSGVTRARWSEVEGATTTYAGEEPVVVLRLRDGRHSAIPVRALDADREELVRNVQDHLQRGHGLRRL